jgi:hypothetical protein
MGIQVKPVYDCKRSSRRQLFGIYADGVLQVICSTYPSWLS